MKKYFIERIDSTGLAKTVFTTLENADWSYEKGNYSANYKELAADLDISPDSIIRTCQTHTSYVKTVTKENGGELVNRPETLHGYDGMITNEKGLLLCTLQADCVPVYILDPVRKAVAMVHSGWKGTAGLISVNAVRLMEEKFGSKSENIIAAMGPCICGRCYEVSGDLIQPFLNNYSKDDTNRFFIKKTQKGTETQFLNNPEGYGKYLLDLPEAIRTALRKIGVEDSNIIDPEYCTFENGQFPSYRRDKTEGRMLTGIMLI